MLHRVKQKIKRLLGLEKYSFERIPRKAYFGKRILSPQEGNDLIYEKLMEDKPCMISRFGSVELACLTNYHKTNGKTWWDFVVRDTTNNAGVFPPTSEALSIFSQVYWQCIKDIDILAVWFNSKEDLIYRQQCPHASLTLPEALEPYYHQNQWSRALENKKVLVIHPFAASIQTQFEHREKLFTNPETLPPFELQTLKAVQSIAHQETPFKDWFEAYTYMCEEISKRDFDIALIGAGGYGLPLASFVKQQGKKAVHMGGATQILFGIKGKRWDEMPFFQSLYNEYWKRPSEEEVPTKAKNVEGGCYW